jgi:hypothetical protein
MPPFLPCMAEAEATTLYRYVTWLGAIGRSRKVPP